MPAAATNPSWRARLRGRLSGMGTRQQLLMLFGLWLLAGTSALLIDGLSQHRARQSLLTLQDDSLRRMSRPRISSR